MTEQRANDEDLQKFWEKHDADPIGVYLVQLYCPASNQTLYGIFTHHDVAHAWAADARKKLPAQENVTALFVPYRLDQPKWGNESDEYFPDIQRM